MFNFNLGYTIDYSMYGYHFATARPDTCISCVHKVNSIDCPLKTGAGRPGYKVSGAGVEGLALVRRAAVLRQCMYNGGSQFILTRYMYYVRSCSLRPVSIAFPAKAGAMLISSVGIFHT